jgi:hypothetical protein
MTSAAPKIEFKRENDQAHVRIVGPIGETSDLFTANLEKIKVLTIDFKELTYINSIGIRSWILWKSSSRFPVNISVVAINCPTVIINQASTVVGYFDSRFTIASLLAPYNCESCQYEEAVLWSLGADYQYATDTKPYSISPHAIKKCPKCGEIMELDVIHDKFFKFLNRP